MLCKLYTAGALQLLLKLHFTGAQLRLLSLQNFLALSVTTGAVLMVKNPQLR